MAVIKPLQGAMQKPMAKPAQVGMSQAFGPKGIGASTPPMGAGPTGAPNMGALAAMQNMIKGMPTPQGGPQGLPPNIPLQQVGGPQGPMTQSGAMQNISGTPQMGGFGFGTITGGPSAGGPQNLPTQLPALGGIGKVAGAFGMKKGGKVEKKAAPKKSSSTSVKVSSASKRGDGIAQRGKTKGRMV